MGTEDKRLFAFKTRIHVNNRQQQVFYRWCGARRKAFNWALEKCNQYREANDGKLPLSKINEIDKAFNAGKYPKGYVRKQKGSPLIGTGEHEWYRDIPASIGQTAIKYDLKAGFQKFFKGQGRPPKFQSRKRRASFSLSNSELKQADITKTHIRLPKALGLARLGDMPRWFSRCKLMRTSVSESGGRWEISFCLEVPDDVYYRKCSDRLDEVGVDIGVKIYAALSTGECHYSPERLSFLEKRAQAIQRKASKNARKRVLQVISQCEACSEKGINGYQDRKKFCQSCAEKLKGQSLRQKKLQASLQRTKARQARIRNDMSHQLTTSLVGRFDKVVIEDLKVKNMTASSKGTIDEPGKQVHQKSGLNRSVLNVAPFKFRTQLEYKADRYGATMTAVNPRNTSRECPECGFTSSENRTTQEKFVCVNCGHKANADTNAARNILNRSKKSNTSANT